MPANITVSVFAEPLAVRLAQGSQPSPAEGEGERREGPNGVLLHWLGQAGFVVTATGHRLLIDPYLSDSLAEKYRGTATPHERMMPAPIAVDDLPPLDLVLVTHHHTDHMDPATLAPLARAQPTLRFVVPAASAAEAARRIGVGADRLILLDAGQDMAPFPCLHITALRAAHETFERDAAGRHRFLGYALRVACGPDKAVTIVHSGDTIPYDGQVAEIAQHRPDLLLLPVNGRSEALRERGIAGNLTLDEAVALTEATGTGAMVAHHHGLFAFNTRSLPEIEARAADPRLPIRLIPARPGLELCLRPP